jgi:multiple sugar transport system permease protein
VSLGSSYSKRLGRAGFLFILPVLMYFTALYWYPLLEAFNMSFKEMMPRMEMRYAGLQAYKDVFADQLFWNSLRNTLLISAISISVTVLLALTLAIAIYNVQPAGLRDLFTMLFLVPSLISFAAAGTIWEWIYHPRFGLANHILSVFGNPGLFQYLSSEQQVLPSVALINIWVRVGFAMLILISGLQSIPESYFEAARVDGARGLRLYWHITIPLLLPQIASITLLEVIVGMKVFDVVYVTTQGGPNNASYTLMLYLYNNAFRFFRTDKASVTAVFIFIWLVLFGVIQRKVVSGRRYEL